MHALTTTQMRRLERRAIEYYRIPAFLLMDHAGRAVADAARQILHRRQGLILVMVGGGNNGGDGVAAARYLQGWGFEVSACWLTNPRDWKGSLARHFALARRVGVRFRSFSQIPAKRRVPELRKAAVIIDSLLGIGTVGPLRVEMIEAITNINAATRPVVSVDLPSGMDPDSGKVAETAVKAKVTVTMTAPKKGLLAREARAYVGRLRVADIGIPNLVFRGKLPI